MLRSVLVLSIALVIAAFAATAMAGPTIKLGHVDPAEWQSSKKGAAGVIFKNIVEGETDISVELFPAKALGDENSLVQQVQEGTTQMTIVSGAMSTVCKTADVLNIPYTFASPTIAWDVLDGPFGKVIEGTEGDNNPLNFPHLSGNFVIGEGLIPGLSFTASYDKVLIRSFEQIFSPEGAVISARINYQTGPAVLSFFYELKYNPETGWAATSDNITSGFESLIKLN